MKDQSPSPLSEEAQWHLQRADGYLDLSMVKEAREELDKIPELLRSHPGVGQIELRLAIASNRWPVAEKLARELCAAFPDEPGYWIQLAYAVRRASTIVHARKILLEIQPRFSSVAVIPFNLACYECQLGHADEAKKYLRSAIELDPQCREMALEDPDLEILWSEIESW